MHPHSLLRRLPVVVGSLALSSCAGPLAPLVIDGVPVQRVTTEYKGRPFTKLAVVRLDEATDGEVKASLDCYLPPSAGEGGYGRFENAL